MTIVAEKYDYAINIGIDTHPRTHTYVIINTATGARTEREAFPLTSNGMNRVIAWVRRNSHGNTLAAVGGTTNSYGSSIQRILTDENISVAEVKPPRKKARNGIGKTDQIDAIPAAMSVLGEDIDALLHPRSYGTRVAISVLLAARRPVEQQ